MRYRRMPIEVESPEEIGYSTIANNLSESSVADRRLGDLGLNIDVDDLLLCYGDHVVVVRTNYATNLETPRAIGADVDIVDLHFEDNWTLDLDELAGRVKPGRTKMISVTCPHNPRAVRRR